MSTSNSFRLQFRLQQWVINALFWRAELKQFCPLPKVILAVVVAWFGLFVYFFSFSQSCWLQHCRSSCLLNFLCILAPLDDVVASRFPYVSTYVNWFAIILVFLFFKFLSVLVRPRPVVGPLQWILSTVPEVRITVQNFIIHFGGTCRCERVNTCFTVSLFKEYSLLWALVASLLSQKRSGNLNGVFPFLNQVPWKWTFWTERVNLWTNCLVTEEDCW